MAEVVHELFRRYPLAGERTISTGTVPVPYHIYDGHGLLIGGTVDLAEARRLLSGQTVQPVVGEDGRGFAVIWICDFSHASLGPHVELQFSLAVAFGATGSVARGRLGLLAAMVNNPALRFFCHGLWNDTDTVIAYNRELLGLPASCCRAVIRRTAGRKEFTFTDGRGAKLAQGQIHELAQTPVSIGFELARLVGLRTALRLAKTPEVSATIVNPIGEQARVNGEAKAIIDADAVVVQPFDPAVDELASTATPYARIDFQPLFSEHFVPFRFVYLGPQPRTHAGN